MSDSRLVYSTDDGDQRRRQPTTGRKAPALPRDGVVRIFREKGNRGGKTVIVIYDFAPQISGSKIEELARKLRSACGCGGTTKERRIEIQGDQASKIRTLLEQEGFRVAGVR